MQHSRISSTWFDDDTPRHRGTEMYEHDHLTQRNHWVRNRGAPCHGSWPAGRNVRSGSVHRADRVETSVHEASLRSGDIQRLLDWGVSPGPRCSPAGRRRTALQLRTLPDRLRVSGSLGFGDTRRNAGGSYHRSTRLPLQSGPSLTYLHSGFLAVSLSAWWTRSKVSTWWSSHSK